MKTKLFVLVLMLCATLSWLNAQDLQGTMEKLSGTAGKSYVDPFSQALAVDFNGGWFHKVPKAELFGWDLEFGVVAMGSLFNSDQKTFRTSESKFRLTSAQADLLIPTEYATYHDQLLNLLISTDFRVGIYGPTIIGNKYDPANEETTSINVFFPDTTLTLPVNGQKMDFHIDGHTYPLGVGGLLSNLPAMPLAAPQLTLGTIAGTQVSIRYLPKTTFDKTVGEISYQGYGIQHNPAFWLPVKIPVDIAFAYFTQDLKVGDLAEVTGTTVGLNVAKTFGFKMLSFSPYAGFSTETSKMKFHYEYLLNTTNGEPTPVNIDFTIDGKNTTRETLGLNFRLGLINLNFDYNLGKYQSATTGFMFNFSF
jgi:hypothetical protein